MRKNAIFMLCMLKDLYFIGACMSAFVHRALMRNNNIDFDLVIMCDDYIYDKYKKTLEFYFDRVINIKLSKYEMKDINAGNRDVWMRKYGWVVYGLNKWQCLNYEEYNKVLFIDVDILPVSKHFYNLFNHDTPSIHVHSGKKLFDSSDCVNNRKITDILKNYSTYNEYIEKSGDNYISLDGGLLLLKPNKKDYNEYIEYLDDIGKNGIYQHVRSGIDETTLFYYYAKYKKNKQFYLICSDNYINIPWDVPKKYTKFYSYNFLSYKKPWTKPTFISWKEETIWREIYHKMIKTKKFIKYYEKNLIDGLKEFKNFDNSFHEQKKYFNVEYKIKNQHIFKNINDDITYDDIVNLENKLNSNNKEHTYDQINENCIKNVFRNIKKYNKIIKKNKSIV